MPAGFDREIPATDGLALCSRARVEFRQVDPVERGVGPVGHFGFFRPRFRGTLWREATDWLAVRLAAGALR